MPSCTTCHFQQFSSQYYPKVRYSVKFFPIFERLHKEYYKHFVFAKVNIEQDKRISYKYNITNLPTCIIIKNGNLAYMHTSIIDYLELKETLERYKNFKLNTND
ncbi:MAG: thioredoxin family protein [Candidatus Heimdallarchaeota archaeon]